MFIRRHIFDDILLDRKPKAELKYSYKNLHVFTPSIIDRIGSLKNAGSGILATLPIPNPLSLEAFDSQRFLILDGIEDLGELGTLLRSASAFDWEAVWITHSCGDPFDPACIRASQGALFDLPYRVGSIDNAVKHARKLTGSNRLRLNPGVRGKITIGLTAPDLSEANLETSSKNMCLLIQRPTDNTRTFRDFALVNISTESSMLHAPLSVTASSLMYAIRDRYFKPS